MVGSKVNQWYAQIVVVLLGFLDLYKSYINL